MNLLNDTFCSKQHWGKTCEREGVPCGVSLVSEAPCVELGGKLSSAIAALDTTANIAAVDVRSLGTGQLVESMVAPVVMY